MFGVCTQHTVAKGKMHTYIACINVTLGSFMCAEMFNLLSHTVFGLGDNNLSLCHIYHTTTTCTRQTYHKQTEVALANHQQIEEFIVKLVHIMACYLWQDNGTQPPRAK